MPKPPSRSDSLALLIAAQVRLAAEYLQDSRLLAANGSRSAVNLLFQSAEAALIAVMTSEGLNAGRATQHQLGAMADTLPDSNPLKPMFRVLEHLTGYATTFRYASPSGRVRAGPPPADLERWQDEMDRIITFCADCFGVDLSSTASSGAARTDPPRGPA